MLFVMPDTTITETTSFGAAQATEASNGRMLVQLINPGWGSSGYYAPQVLEAAARDRVFPAGTHMYLDHPSESEQLDRPERSVRDIAAVLSEDAAWTGNALVAEARVFTPYRAVLSELADAIGVSIRATADVSEGEADGRQGRIVERLGEAASVDFVTQAGRGGRVLAVLESTRTSTESVPVDPAGQPTQEEPMPDIEEALRGQLDEATGRVSALETERDTAMQQRDTAVSERDTAVAALRDATARRVVAEAGVTGARLTEALAANPPLTEAGEVDTDKLHERVTEALAELDTSNTGNPRGVGVAPDPNPLDEQGFASNLSTAFGLSESAAQRAAAGRR